MDYSTRLPFNHIFNNALNRSCWVHFRSSSIFHERTNDWNDLLLIFLIRSFVAGCISTIRPYSLHLGNRNSQLWILVHVAINNSWFGYIFNPSHTHKVVQEETVTRCVTKWTLFCWKILFWINWFKLSHSYSFTVIISAAWDIIHIIPFTSLLKNWNLILIHVNCNYT